MESDFFRSERALSWFDFVQEVLEEVVEFVGFVHEEGVAGVFEGVDFGGFKLFGIEGDFLAFWVFAGNRNEGREFDLVKARLESESADEQAQAGVFGGGLDGFDDALEVFRGWRFAVEALSEGTQSGGAIFAHG